MRRAAPQLFCAPGAAADRCPPVPTFRLDSDELVAHGRPRAVGVARIFLPRPSRRVGHAGDLLLQPALGMGAIAAGGRVLRGHRLGPLDISHTARVARLRVSIPRRRRVVHLHLPVPEPRVAAGGHRGAAGDHRRRPRTSDRRPQFRLSHGRRFHPSLRGARGFAVASHGGRLLHIVLDARAHRAHVRELHLRQCAARVHLHRSPRAGGSELRARSARCSSSSG